MSMPRIRAYYSVPAKRGMRILFNGTPCIITAATVESMRLRVRPVAGGRIRSIHPTWEVEYPTLQDQQKKDTP